MHTIRFYFLVIALVAPSLAYASLPKSSNVPGGIAIVPLGIAIARAEPPQAWLEKQPVLVTFNDNQWHAVVGLSLGMAAGSYLLHARIGGESKAYEFKVFSKAYPKQHITIKDKGKVQLSADDQARAKREIAHIKRLKRHWRAALDTDSGFILPAEGRMSSRFGFRRIFNGEPRTPHSGLDVAAPIGTQVKAASHGKVLAVGDYFLNGKTIFLDHGNGLITLYCHLDRIDVKIGDSVDKGQLIGLMGQTGRSTGPHLHWSVVLNGAMVDPELFVTTNRFRNSD